MMNACTVVNQTPKGTHIFTAILRNNLLKTSFNALMRAISVILIQDWEKSCSEIVTGEMIWLKSLIILCYYKQVYKKIQNWNSASD